MNIPDKLVNDALELILKRKPKESDYDNVIVITNGKNIEITTRVSSYKLASIRPFFDRKSGKWITKTTIARHMKEEDGIVYVASTIGAEQWKQLK